MPQTSSSQLYLNELCLNFHSRTWLNVPAKFRTTHLNFRLLHRLLLQSAGCKCFQITNLLHAILFLHLYDVYGRSHQECFFTDFGRTQISTVLYSFDTFDKVLLKLKELSHSKKTTFTGVRSRKLVFTAHLSSFRRHINITDSLFTKVKVTHHQIHVRYVSPSM